MTPARIKFLLFILIVIGLAIFIWIINPLIVFVVCGISFILGILIMIAFIYVAELSSFEDWDLLIRSVLHRLGFQVQTPKSLMHEHDLSDPETWEHHHHEYKE